MDGIERTQSLILAIPLTAEKYGGRKDVADMILDACIDLVENRFGFLSIPEITTAYEMWASGELKIKGAEMWGGEFNAFQLGKVLGGYRDYRAKILAAYLTEKDKQNETEKAEAKAEILKNEFEENFPRMIMEGKQQIQAWSQVPAFWYQALKTRGYISLTGAEMAAITTEAQIMAIKEMNNRKEEEKNIYIKYTAETFLEIRNNIAFQMAVFQKVISNKNFKI